MLPQTDLQSLRSHVTTLTQNITKPPCRCDHDHLVAIADSLLVPQVSVGELGLSLSATHSDLLNFFLLHTIYIIYTLLEVSQISNNRQSGLFNRCVVLILLGLGDVTYIDKLFISSNNK